MGCGVQLCLCLLMAAQFKICEYMFCQIPCIDKNKSVYSAIEVEVTVLPRNY